jgi:hypothetical protein
VTASLSCSFFRSWSPAAQEFRRKLEQFRISRDVPVGVRDIGMTQVSRELGQLTLYIQTGSIPLDELPSYEGMSKIL